MKQGRNAKSFNGSGKRTYQQIGSTSLKGIRHTRETGQSALEYLVTYGWAVLLIAVVASLLYLYLGVPHIIAPSSCSFISNVYCNDLVVGSNSSTHATTLAVFLTNTQSYPILNPKLFVNVNKTNTSAYPCSPKYVLPGGAIICQVTLPVQTSLGSFLSGSVYLSASYCGFSSNMTQQGCQNAPIRVYSGSFTTHTSPLVSTTTSITLHPKNSTQSAISGIKDPLYATVKLLGYPLSGATVNFTAVFVSNGTNAVPPFSINPPITTTNTTGTALSYTYGPTIANVLVSAHYAGYNSSVYINFVPPIIITFSLSPNIGSTLSSSPSTIATIDGIGYDYSQLSTATFDWNVNSVHYINFTTQVYKNSTARLVFNYTVINGVTYTNPNITYTTPSSSQNVTISVNYYTQYYLTELSIPNGAGSVSPGSSWYNASSGITISESTISQYLFKSWECSGGGCYSGTATSAPITINYPINEQANYYSTTTSTTSTSTTSSTSSTTTSVTTTSTSTSTTSTSVTTTSTSTSTSTSTTSTSTSTIATRVTNRATNGASNGATNSASNKVSNGATGTATNSATCTLGDSKCKIG